MQGPSFFPLVFTRGQRTFIVKEPDSALLTNVEEKETYKKTYMAWLGGHIVSDGLLQRDMNILAVSIFTHGSCIRYSKVYSRRWTCSIIGYGYCQLNWIWSSLNNWHIICSIWKFPLHIPPTLGSAPLLHMLNNTWSIRHCSLGNMVGVKLYLFVILLLGILLVAIKSSNLYMFIGHLYFLFYEVPEQVICPLYYWISQVKNKRIFDICLLCI